MNSGASLEKKDEHRNQPLPEPDRGDAYIWRCQDVESRLRIASHISKTRQIKDATVLLRKVSDRIAIGDEQVLFLSDKLKAYPKGLLRVFGVSEPAPERPTGRPRKSEKRTFPQFLLYGQIVKERRHGHLVCIERKAVVGTMDQILAVLRKCGHCKMINISFVERDNLSFRQHNGRMVRKTLSYSKNWQMHQDSIDLEDAVHNLVRPHLSLREPNPGPRGRKWKARTPAMAAGLTDHVWSIKELFNCRLPPRL
jgi:hypothetical protein